ncbi:hypothetical protein L211DRAFT_93499 [Terfezia boudieri ATCC MYA-4762]|uniref:Uncharacterized protein n=1 Tax=Terfezia boudieri ATCC MYA-4762 TaxID=1051890 RepID=A0A3N4LVA7_9PEZI|nr:hypothetical protein L211DRAFT_93499 [Terfezia boudieri ATCC MYA-4762]
MIRRENTSEKVYLLALLHLPSASADSLVLHEQYSHDIFPGGEFERNRFPWSDHQAWWKCRLCPASGKTIHTIASSIGDSWIQDDGLIPERLSDWMMIHSVYSTDHSACQSTRAARDETTGTNLSYSHAALCSSLSYITDISHKQ